jgi:hypothetical protein
LLGIEEQPAGSLLGRLLGRSRSEAGR